MSDPRRSFEENGYYLARGVYSATEVAELELDFDRIVAQLLGSGENVNARWGGAAMDRMKSAGTVVIHTHNVQLYSAVWMRAMFHPKFVEAAQQVCGSPDVILHHTKLFQKPPEKGAPFPMHQDWHYFPTVNDSMFAAVIHVSEATDEMGCFRVYPHSHRLGRASGTGGMGSAENREILDKYPIEKATILEAQPGDVLFFHYFTLHGSMPNRSADKTRKTVLIQMHRGDDRVEDGNNHPNARLALSGWNHAMTRSIANRGT